MAAAPFNMSEILHMYTGDGLAMITTAPPPVTEITPNHQGYDVS